MKREEILSWIQAKSKSPKEFERRVAEWDKLPPHLTQLIQLGMKLMEEKHSHTFCPCCKRPYWA